jgi:hypothetical protein
MFADHSDVDGEEFQPKPAGTAGKLLSPFLFLTFRQQMRLKNAQCSTQKHTFFGYFVVFFIQVQINKYWSSSLTQSTAILHIAIHAYSIHFCQISL